MHTKTQASEKSFLWGMIKTSFSPSAIATKGNTNSIITQLAAESVDRSRAEIKKWRTAIDTATNPETPRWQPLQDIIENMMTDGHLMANVQIRKAAVMSTRFYITDKSGKENPEKSLLLQTEWFYNLIEHLLDTPYRGYTVMELVDPVNMEWSLIPRRNIIPQFKKVLFEVGGDKGVFYNDPSLARNVLFTHSINPLGVINDVIPQLIWKRNAQQTWADFSERFGIPLVTIETNKTDKKDLDKLEAMGRAMGQSSQAVLPEGTKITIHDPSTKGDPHNVFNQQIERSNEEVSKRILGGTMVTDSGSSRSQSEVHERTLDSKIAEADRRLIEFTVNGKLIPLLRTWGFKFADGDVFLFDRTEDLSMTQHWNIINKALSFYDIPTDWVGKRFNFPIDGVKKQALPTPANIASPKPSALSENFR